VRVDLADELAEKIVVTELQWSIENGGLEHYELKAFQTVLEYFMSQGGYKEWLRRIDDMADMEWVRKTHTDYIEGMKQHGDELENNNERHLYGAAINRINLLMEHIDELEAQLTNGKAAIKRMLPKLREHLTEEYILHELIRGTGGE